MMKNLRFFALFALLSAMLPALRAEMLSFQFDVKPHASFKGVSDTYIRADNPAVKNPASSGLNVGTVAGKEQNAMRTLLFFHVAAIPEGSKIKSVSLRLSVRSAADKDLVVEVHELTRPFAASYASWKNATQDIEWKTPGGDAGNMLAEQTVRSGTAAGAWIAFEKSDALVKAVQAAIDNGWPLCFVLLAPRQEKRADRAFVSFNSSETQNVNLRPEFVVELEKP
ncbi:DNRLRE domain-containing protein [Termitidicoccus mucosus]|uniref:DNRLRE domain-containing protein n=1 Tax=Termitidicoccus mucosus TaxID=1184151 RepID=A0A178IB86_9BACT|nr:hypothetical protein AW736_23855 [Opitutaceae bacterium TSB47]